MVYVILSTGLLCLNHYLIHLKISLINLSLFFFCSLNILICIWEIILGLYIEEIYNDYIKLKEKYKNDKLQACKDFFFQEISISQIFSPKTWVKVLSKNLKINKKRYLFVI
jgi:hypothetical protein